MFASSGDLPNIIQRMGGIRLCEPELMYPDWILGLREVVPVRSMRLIHVFHVRRRSIVSK